MIYKIQHCLSPGCPRWQQDPAEKFKPCFQGNGICIWLVKVNMDSFLLSSTQLRTSTSLFGCLYEARNANCSKHRYFKYNLSNYIDVIVYLTSAFLLVLFYFLPKRLLYTMAWLFESK